MLRWVVILSCAWPAATAAYELEGGAWPMWQYPSGVPYCPVINAKDATTSNRSQFGQTIDDAMNAWTQAGGVNTPGISCSPYLARKSTCSNSPNINDRQPWVYWEAAWDSKGHQ